MGPVHLCSPFLAGSGGGIQLHTELQRCSRLSKDICFFAIFATDHQLSPEQM